MQGHTSTQWMVCLFASMSWSWFQSVCDTGAADRALLSAPRQQTDRQEKLALRWQKLEGQLLQVGGAAALFMHLYGHQGAQDTFWLDRWS